jgi:integration host factor subunit alpha
VDDLAEIGTSESPEGAIMTLVKEDLIESLYNQCQLSKHQSRTLVEAVFELVKKTLESGDDVMISGFGKFYRKEKSARRGRNPATGKGMILDGRTVVIFRSSPVLREKINGAE